MSFEKRSIFNVDFMRFLVCFESLKPNLSANLTALNARVGSSTKLRLCSTLMVLSFRSRWAPKKSTNCPKSLGFSLTARVLMVKSRR